NDLFTHNDNDTIQSLKRIINKQVGKIFNFSLDSFISKELSEKNICNIKKNYYEEPNKRNNAEKTYSEESSEINNTQKTYSKKLSKINNYQKTYLEENKEVSLDYSQEFEQFFSLPSEYNIFGLELLNQFLLTGYSFDKWQSTKNLENLSALIYEEKLTETLENHSALIYEEQSSTKKLENPSALIYKEQSTNKLECPSELIYGEKSTKN
ncbi:6860_t:CDS:2, partial [Cetraspora pellucida]